MKLTEKQKNCPYCHGGNDHQPIYDSNRRSQKFSVNLKHENDKHHPHMLVISCKSDTSDDDWFIRISLYQLGWSAITANFDTCLDDDVNVMDLVCVMDVVQRLVSTPIKERFPEKKYVLSAIRCAEGPLAIKQYVDAINISTNNVEFHFGLADEKADAMEFTQNELDDLSDFFPKVAIDAMKEPVEDIK